MAKSGKKIRIFSALEVANICGVVNQTAINWIKNNHLKAFTTPGGQYRIYAEDLLDFLQSRGMRVPEELQEIAQTKKKKILIIEKRKTRSCSRKLKTEKKKLNASFENKKMTSILMQSTICYKNLKTFLITSQKQKQFAKQ